MTRKVDRALHGPSWFEVIFGAILSVILGIALGALFLVIRPVEPVKALPKAEERNAKAVYYVEGSKDYTRGRDAPAKRKAFAEGQSVTLTEDHLNALAREIAPGKTPAPAPKPVEKAKPAEKTKAGEKAAPSAEVAEEYLVLGTPNFRVDEGMLQMAVPVTINVIGLSRQVIAQTRGTFVKRDAGFVFEPAEIHIGSCPLILLPYVADYAKEQIRSLPVPDDIKASWAKLANVAVDGKSLKLTMP